ncbi:hypothetical protein E2C01_092527 [Portunus trituberculatus]|uniref:Uncharacterized protein n=1 Tax=Portunus trituberculatus TaxID=210409 RepID=A0A5B7JY02_PORTR|nr:hypothetical protein [Portunus trituberculatus]
MVREQNITE